MRIAFAGALSAALHFRQLARPRRRYRGRQGEGRTVRRLSRRKRHFADGEHSLARGRSPTSSSSGNWCSSAPAPARTSRCSRSSNSSTTTTSAISAPISRSSRRRRRRAGRQSGSVEEGRAGGRRPALRLMPYRQLRRHQGGRPHRRPARGISVQGAARLQIGRAVRRRPGGDGRCRLSPERRRDRSARALSGAFVMSSRPSAQLRTGAGTGSHRLTLDPSYQLQRKIARSRGMVPGSRSLCSLVRDDEK